MEDQENPTNSVVKSFFSTLPGIITAIAGLITALGGFILILNRTGCMSAKTDVASGEVVKKDSANSLLVQENVQSGNLGNGNKVVAGQNVLYSSAEIKVTLKSLVYKITSAEIEVLPTKEMVLSLKVKCTNNSQYEYHFYSKYFRIQVGDDIHTCEPGSPSSEYQSVGALKSKQLEYIYKLPAGTKSFNLIIYDEDAQMASTTLTLK